jgi:hypothetical protein
VQDLDCLPRGMAVCQQSTPGAPGVCFPKTEPRDPERLRRCARLLGSRRRYDIVRSTTTRLDLALKINELPRTSLDPCTKDADCQNSSVFMGYECKAVREGEPRRCVKSCKEDRDCRGGTVCEMVPGGATLCVDAPPLDAANASCFPEDISYKIQAGNSFLVTHSLLSANGLSVTPAPAPRTTREQDGVCTADPTRNALLVNRIPLSAPACTGLSTMPSGFVSTKDARDKMPMAAMGWGNPCLFRAPNADETGITDPCTKDADCQTAAGFSCLEVHYGEGLRCVKSHVKALFQTPDYRIVLTNLDQYAGDAVRMRFEMDGGFLPSAASTPEDILMSMPVRIVTGPTKTPDSPTEQAAPPSTAPSFPYFYIVDQGRTATAPGGRGQVLRLDPRAGATGQIASGLSTSTRSRFQIQ